MYIVQVKCRIHLGLKRMYFLLLRYFYEVLKQIYNFRNNLNQKYYFHKVGYRVYMYLEDNFSSTLKNIKCFMLVSRTSRIQTLIIQINPITDNCSEKCLV